MLSGVFTAEITAAYVFLFSFYQTICKALTSSIHVSINRGFSTGIDSKSKSDFPASQFSLIQSIILIALGFTAIFCTASCTTYWLIKQKFKSYRDCYSCEVFSACYRRVGRRAKRYKSLTWQGEGAIHFSMQPRSGIWQILVQKPVCG